MKMTYEMPDSLFVTPTIVTGFYQSYDEMTVTGYPVDEGMVRQDMEDDKWHTDNGFGFVMCANANLLDGFEKMYQLKKMIQFSAKMNYDVEFLVYADKGYLSLYWRSKGPQRL